MADSSSSAARPPSNKQTERLQRDLLALRNNPLPFVRNIELSVEDNLNQVSGMLDGPVNSDYAGGHFHFKIRFPSVYPFVPPEFVFVTKICHPNIDLPTGTACHDILLSKWAPPTTLPDLLTHMHSLLANPNYGAPVEESPSMVKNPETARKWTQVYAQSLD